MNKESSEMVFGLEDEENASDESSSEEDEGDAGEKSDSGTSNNE